MRWIRGARMAPVFVGSSSKFCVVVLQRGLRLAPCPSQAVAIANGNTVSALLNGFELPDSQVVAQQIEQRIGVLPLLISVIGELSAQVELGGAALVPAFKPLLELPGISDGGAPGELGLGQLESAGGVALAVGQARRPDGGFVAN